MAVVAACVRAETGDAATTVSARVSAKVSARATVPVIAIFLSVVSISRPVRSTRRNA